MARSCAALSWEREVISARILEGARNKHFLWTQQAGRKHFRIAVGADFRWRTEIL